MQHRNRQVSPGRLGLSKAVLHSKLVNLDQQVHNKQEHLNKQDNLDLLAPNRQVSLDPPVHSKGRPNKRVNRGLLGLSKQEHLNKLAKSDLNRQELLNKLAKSDLNKQELLNKLAKSDLNRLDNLGLEHHSKRASSDQLGLSNLRPGSPGQLDLNRALLLNKLDNKELLHHSRRVKQDQLVLSKLDSQDLLGLSRQANLARLHLNRVASPGNQLLKGNLEANLLLVLELEHLVPIRW